MSATNQADRSPTQGGPAGEHRSGPLPGTITTSRQWFTAQAVRKKFTEHKCDSDRELHFRVHGVQLIDTVRLRLSLPLSTFITACSYFHKFRLDSPPYDAAEYGYQDAALASLLLACKVEETYKKPKDILISAYQLKHPDKVIASDEKFMNLAQTTMIVLERNILEKIGFNFCICHPHKLLPQFIRIALGPSAVPGSADYRQFSRLAYDMAVDVFKTNAPLKQTSSSMAIAVVTLAARLTDRTLEHIREMTLGPQLDDRGAVTETMFDLIELYTESRKHTRIGPLFGPDTYVQVRLAIDNDEGERRRGNLFQSWCGQCLEEDSANRQHRSPVEENEGGYPARNEAWSPPGPEAAPPTDASHVSSQQDVSNPAAPYSEDGAAPPTPPVLAASTPRGRAGRDSTLRYIFDRDRAQEEMETVDRYLGRDWEEHEMEVEEEMTPDPMPAPPSAPPTGPAAPTNGPRRDRDRRKDRDRDRDRHRDGRRGGRGGGGYVQGHGHGGNRIRNHQGRRNMGIGPY